jgi:hypothetical protein
MSNMRISAGRCDLINGAMSENSHVLGATISRNPKIPSFLRPVKWRRSISPWRDWAALSVCASGPLASTAAAIHRLTRTIAVSRASRVRWRYQRDRAWWHRRQSSQCPVLPGGGGWARRRPVSGTVSGSSRTRLAWAGLGALGRVRRCWSGGGSAGDAGLRRCPATPRRTSARLWIRSRPSGFPSRARGPAGRRPLQVSVIPPGRVSRKLDGICST